MIYVINKDGASRVPQCPEGPWWRLRHMRLLKELALLAKK